MIKKKRQACKGALTKTKILNHKPSIFYVKKGKYVRYININYLSLKFNLITTICILYI